MAGVVYVPSGVPMATVQTLPWRTRGGADDTATGCEDDKGMSDTPMAAEVKDHFARAWNMLIAAAGNFGDNGWRVADDARIQPARIACHVLMAAERYTWTGEPDTYLDQRVHSFDWQEDAVTTFPGREDCLRLLQDMKGRCLAWVDGFENGLSAEKPAWPWTGKTALGQALYHLRHLQHHLAELNAELRRRGLPTVEWQ